MNNAMVKFILAWVLKVEGVLMLLPCIIALIYGEREGLIYLMFAVPAMLVGHVFSKRPENMEIYQKEGFVSVGLSWVLMSCYGALPFVATREIPNFINALFEIVSGFTTTGATIISDVEALSHVSLFWRSFSHWIGGMGVLVFILMMIPTRGGGSHMNLMKAESPGPDVSKFVPRVRATARLLYKIYLSLTVAEIVLLIITRMYWFDAVCISFGTAGTGGFGVLNSSCASYSAVQQWIIIIFMAAFGVNFAFYYMIIAKRAKEALKLEEVRAYLLIIGVATVIIAANVLHYYGSAGISLRESAFQVVSIITTTGFTTTNYDFWPSLPKAILVVLMMIGACAGSTGGGIKVGRLLIMGKTVRSEMRQLLSPRSIQRISMDGQSLQSSTLHSVFAFLMGYVILFCVSLLVISYDGFSFETNFSAIAATLNNVGPGLAGVGPAGNYLPFGAVSKLVMIFDMLAGRLELLPIFVLFYPGTWKRH